MRSPADPAALARWVSERLLLRNEAADAFFRERAGELAEESRGMAERFARGGRLLAFGQGPWATDAQHVSVEFVHPVIVGKRALPAADLSAAFERWLPALVGPDDMAMGFGPPGGDPEIEAAMAVAAERGARTFALPGTGGRAPDVHPSSGYRSGDGSDDPFVHQEMIEILYHVLWETVHVFLEHRERGHDVGASGFLYPYLGTGAADAGALVEGVAGSILAKVDDDRGLREAVAREQSERIAEVARSIHGRLDAGGRLLLFGNGGSATDANDWALDCVAPPPGRPALPALSLAMEPACLSAVANDVGVELVFLRQIVAHGRPGDVAVAISTSGGSSNVLSALAEARSRGLLTVALVGYDGGEVLRDGLADMVLTVPSDYVPRIQEVHASIYHTLLDALHGFAGGHG